MNVFFNQLFVNKRHLRPAARCFVISTCQRSSFSWHWQDCLRSDWFALPHDAQYMARPSASPRQRPPRSSNPLL